MEVRKRKKRGSTDTVIIISDTGEKMKLRCTLPRFHKMVMIVAITILVLGVAGIAIIFSVHHNQKDMIAALEANLNVTKEENDKLLSENSELNDKVELLGVTITKKVAKEEEEAAEYAKKRMPTHLPLDGTAGMPEEIEENGEKALQFSAGVGASITAVGDGVVVSVAEDEDYGNVIKIDHENEYVTVYYNNAKTRVSEGDVVTRGTVLYEIGEGNERFIYQIYKNDEYIDPLTMMDING